MTEPTDALVDRLDRIEHVLKDKGSLRKNGATNIQWVGRVLTNERLLLGILVAFQVVFVFGGRVVRYERDVAAAVTVASDALLKASAALDRERELREQLVELGKRSQSLADAQATLALRKDVAALDAKLRLAATRADLLDLRQMILPRLERIEQGQKGTP